MKILQINKFFYTKGGAETYLLALISLLQKNGHEVIGFSQANKNNINIKGQKFFLEEINLDKFYLKNIFKIGRIFWSFQAKKNIKKLIIQENVDLVHLHNIYHQISPSILPELKKAGRPIVMTVHDFKLVDPYYTLWAIKNKKSAKSWLAKLLMALEYRCHKIIGVYQKNIDLFIAPSNFVKSKLVEAGFDLNKIIVLPHFAELSYNSSQPEEKNYIVAFGRLDVSKGFDLLLGALAKLTDGAKLKIVGSGPAEKSLKKLAQDLKLGNKVEFSPYSSKEKLTSIISQSLFVVFPSLVHETFGLGIIESYFLGKPVIASRVGSFSEIVTPETGLLFEPADIDGLKTALETLIHNRELRLALGQGARQMAEEKFTGQQHFDKIIDIYKALVKEAGTKKFQ